MTTNTNNTTSGLPDDLMIATGHLTVRANLKRVTVKINE